MHAIFQRHHIPPDEVYAKDRRHQMFMFASMMLVFEEEEKERKTAEREARVRRINAGGR
ncbi:hypothetical protein J42TS3_42800 [Paenibacillus vini]|uniref:Uncharacterized protein n=1 Tax=Paenibacillus vini TaxID=1476024 RepID=A0ABQ4MGY7_9BACL|nr:hypothetical protein J42TS3_42800 [Paenibacillus vini]